MQYSIRDLALWTAATAVLCTLLFAVPDVAAALIMLGLLAVLPVPLVSGLLYARGWRWTFFLGSAIAAAPGCLWIAFYLPAYVLSGFMGLPVDEDSAGFHKIILGSYLGYIAAAGGLAVLVRWLVSDPTDDPSPRGTADQDQP